VRQILVITRLTFREARRRRMLWLGLAMGLAFVGLFSAGFYFAWTDFTRTGTYYETPFDEYRFFATTFLTAGLYVVNFLLVMVTVLTTVGTISAEIDSNTIHAIAAKPIRRREIILGKWLGHALMVLLYTLLLATGVMLSTYLISGRLPAHAVSIVLILWLEGLTVLGLTLMGSTVFSTLANGVMVFMLYGVGFVGGWVEQIGSLLDSGTAVDIGVASSLLMPTEALWRYAAALLQGEGGLLNQFTPFTVASEPTPAFVLYAAIYAAAMLVGAVWSFSRRDF
jgi:ABC-type transport system involved in multi-copper enzyme maturation permease subunit